jgi:hypothetical protein
MSGLPGRQINFDSINSTAMARLLDILSRWLPDGRREGHEWTARNPRRADRKPGSFRVNIDNGRWADFATNDRGGDPVSLAAYLGDLSQVDAALHLADMLGVDPYGR